MSEDLYYEGFKVPDLKVLFATNLFVNVPVILQVGDRPILQVGRAFKVGIEEDIQLHYRDGSDLGRLKGGRLYLTDAGQKAGVKIRKLAGIDVVELGAQTLCELRRPSAWELHPTAELYSRTGLLVRAGAGASPSVTLPSASEPFAVGGAVYMGNVAVGCRIGFWVSEDGRQVAWALNATPPIEADPGMVTP